MKRLTIVLAFLFFFTAAFSTLNRIYSQKFLATTGEARWIWAQHRLSSNEPVAFFAARDFDLPAKRYYTRLKVAADPEYELFVNGKEIAGRQTGVEPTLDLYDISSLVQTGRNRIVVAVRAPQGMGGLLASIDIAPETANWIVSDGSWTIYRRWHPDLLLRDVAGVPSQPPMIVGAPPVGRWNFPTIVARALEPPPGKIVPPRDSRSMIAVLPTIRMRADVAVAVTERSRATAFDFGFTRGRVRLTRDFRARLQPGDQNPLRQHRPRARPDRLQPPPDRLRPGRAQRDDHRVTRLSLCDGVRAGGEGGGGSVIWVGKRSRHVSLKNDGDR